jgi:hypothetical protein
MLADAGSSGRRLILKEPAERLKPGARSRNRRFPLVGGIVAQDQLDFVWLVSGQIPAATIRTIGSARLSRTGRPGQKGAARPDVKPAVR